MKSEKRKIRVQKNFFALILHTYIDTLYNTHSLSVLHGF